MTQPTDEFKAGQRVAITQQIPRKTEVWTDRIVGEVLRSEHKKTG